MIQNQQVNKIQESNVAVSVKINLFYNNSDIFGVFLPFLFRLKMKIICEISVQNRLVPHLKPRSHQSTLALGYHPPSVAKDAENLFLIHFTATNKTGTRYKIKRNLQKVFTNFLHEGKTTISMKQPPHDLLIRCEPVQLKAFIQTFKLAYDGKLEPNKLGLSTLAVTGVPKKSMPVKTMTITSPVEYPVRGLPKSLNVLNVIMSGYFFIQDVLK